MAKRMNLETDARNLMSELGIVHINRYMSERKKHKKEPHAEKPLSLWNQNAVSGQTLLSYVRRVTN